MNIYIRRILIVCLLLAPVLSAQDQDQQPAPDKRAFGVLPNYRTVEGSIPFKPISAKRKLYIATKDTIDGPSYVTAAVFGTIYQATNQNPSFGQGMKGYAHRYLCSIADQDIGNYMTEGIMPALLREDPRYFRLGEGSKKKRVFYALSRVLITRTDHNHQMFNFAEFVGNGVTGAVGNAYYPDGVGFGPTMQRTFTQIGTDSISNVLKEFWPDVKKHLASRKQQKQP
ncbi:MAG TPA: hypothetical protein VHC90_03925 [Bryobacteraceae bacterium]|nr:hypothetical protein [Bryobacteraceae bacterium]